MLNNHVPSMIVCVGGPFNGQIVTHNGYEYVFPYVFPEETKNLYYNNDQYPPKADFHKLKYSIKQLKVKYGSLQISGYCFVYDDAINWETQAVGLMLASLLKPL